MIKSRMITSAGHVVCIGKTKNEYKVLATLQQKTAFNCGSKTWLLNKRDRQRLEAAQMRFLRPLLRYIKLYLQRNVDIRELLIVQSILEEIQTYQKNCIEHVEMMQDERIPKLELNTNQWENEVDVVPKINGNTSSWKRLEEYRINKPSQQFKINKKKILVWNSDGKRPL
jgi:cell fate (sporulation/competence/biofilm development) regulator YmcA (YheA/YmcA/DUF963 family)